MNVDSLKDQLGALYNLLTVNLFSHVTKNSCKFNEDEYCDAEPSKLTHFNEELQEFKDFILEPFRESGVIPMTDMSRAGMLLDGSQGLTNLLD